jgi:uncharacterized damage-inducible protein DinB
MTAGLLRYLFDYNHGATRLNCAGLTHEDSLLLPQPAGSCANWVLGHMIAFRSTVLATLGDSSYWTEAEIAPYARGSERLDPARARRFEALLRDLDVTQEGIRAGLARWGEEALAATVPGEKRTLAERLFFLQFHEAYHVGQLGLLRRLAGRPGAI